MPGNRYNPTPKQAAWVQREALINAPLMRMGLVVCAHMRDSDFPCDTCLWRTYLEMKKLTPTDAADSMLSMTATYRISTIYSQDDKKYPGLRSIRVPLADMPQVLSIVRKHLEGGALEVRIETEI